MKFARIVSVSFIFAALMVAIGSNAEPVPVQKPSGEEEIKAALTGGVPMGRWKEGLLFEGVRPMP